MSFRLYKYLRPEMALNFSLDSCVVSHLGKSPNVDRAWFCHQPVKIAMISFTEGGLAHVPWSLDQGHWYRFSTRAGARAQLGTGLCFSIQKIQSYFPDPGSEPAPKPCWSQTRESMTSVGGVFTTDRWIKNINNWICQFSSVRQKKPILSFCKR